MKKFIEGILQRLADLGEQYGITPKLKTVWGKIWGADPLPIKEVSDYNEYGEMSEEQKDKYWQIKELYNKKVFKLKTRRGLIKCILFILAISITWNIVSETYEAIRGSYLVNCFGREVCIYRGPKLNYPGSNKDVIPLKDGKLFLARSSRYNYFYHKLMQPRRLFNLIASFSGFYQFDEKFSKLLPGYVPVSAEIYNHKQHRFIKLKKPPFSYEYKSVYKYGDNGILFLGKKDNPDGPRKRASYNLITKQYTVNEERIFTKINSVLNTSLFIYGQYDPDHILTMTNYNKGPHGYKYRFSGAPELKTYNRPERLYLINVRTNSIESLPKFAKDIMYAPRQDDLIILKDGTIILPIRTSASYGGNSSQRLIHWDHIEIYDPITDKFTAELNTKVLKDNLFDIELPDGNILFINKNSSWIFNNKTKKFEPAPKELQAQNINTVKMIDDKLKNHIGIDLEEKIYNKTKIIKVDSDKFLLTCDGNYLDYPYKKNEICKNTIYYNYSKNKIKKGPRFLFPTLGITIAKIDNKNLLIIGGEPAYGLFTGMYETALPNNHAQIIRVKE